MANKVRPSTYSDCKSRLRGNGEPIFNLSDLCRILEISNSSRVANEVLDDDLRITYPIIDSLGRNQNAMKEK